MRGWAAIGILAAWFPAHAQSPQLRDLIEQRIESIADRQGDESDLDLTAIFEVLVDRYENPLDLNHAAADELAELQLLSDVQIAALQEHIRTEGPLLSIYELQTIDAMDAATIELVRPFVSVREQGSNIRVNWHDALRQSEHELIARTVFDIRQRRGYMDRNNPWGPEYADPDGEALPDLGDPLVVDSLRANNKVYLGSPYKAYARYRLRYRRNLDLGITAEKDEGEEFFTGKRPEGTQPNGFDFYSAHFFVRDLGVVKAVALGDYQAQFGQGLTYWTGLAFNGKSSYTMNVRRGAPGLSPYASVNENLFLRGAGVTAGISKHFDVTAFWSLHEIDGNIVRGDTTESGTVETGFSSFQEDGLHRTTLEATKKDAITERTVGGHVRYHGSKAEVGVTAVSIEFSGTLTRDLKPYNQYEFTGKTLNKYGADWNLNHRNLTWFGEVAFTDPGGNTPAWLSGMLVALDRRVSFSALYRDFPRDFAGLYSVAFAEGSNAWNERGLYAGVEVKPSRAWTINAYFDQYRFPWLRYQTDAPSGGNDVLGQITWKPSKTVELYGRARRRLNQKNAQNNVEGVDPLVDVVQANYRVNANFKVSRSTSLRTRVETTDFQRGDGPLQHGFLLAQDVVHRPLRSPVELTLRVALFESASYDARIYAYENDLVGLYSIPAHYGRGMRWYAMARLTPTRRVDVWLRYGAWLWNGQDRYSSGLSEINGSGDPATGTTIRDDVKVQVRWKF